MHTITSRSMRLPLWAAGVTAALTGAIALTALLVTSPDADAVTAEIASEIASTDRLVAVTAGAAQRLRSRAAWCAGCAVIQATREFQQGDGDAAGRPQGGALSTTVRRPDGSMLVINDSHPERWRRGERVNLIAGSE